MINMSIGKIGDAIIKIKIGDVEFMGIPTKVVYNYRTSNINIEIMTKVAPEIAEKIFKETKKGEINVKTD